VSKACWLLDMDAQEISSTPQACGLVFRHRAGARRSQRLPGWRDPFQFVAKIVEVFLADVQGEHFLDHG